MTPERIRTAIRKMPEDEAKQLRDAYYAAAAGIANLDRLLKAANDADLAKERTIASELKNTINRSVLGSVL
jgi:hypothetical protein